MSVKDVMERVLGPHGYTLSGLYVPEGISEVGYVDFMNETCSEVVTVAFATEKPFLWEANYMVTTRIGDDTYDDWAVSLENVASILKQLVTPRD